MSVLTDTHTLPPHITLVSSQESHCFIHFLNPSHDLGSLGDLLL